MLMRGYWKKRVVLISAVLSQLCCVTGATPLAGTVGVTQPPGRRLQVVAGLDAGTALQFKTVMEALAVAQPGDTVVLREGVYREAVRFPRSGLADRPIVVMAQPGEHVVLDGAQVDIPRWQGLISILNESYIVIQGLEVRNSSQRGVVAYSRDGNTTGIVIQDCVVSHTEGAGIVLEQVKDCRVENSEAGYAGNGSPGFLLNRCENIDLFGCRAHHNGQGGGGTAQGFLIYEGRNLRLQNCLAEKNVRDGFDIGGGQMGATGVSLKQCVSRQNGEDGVGINSWATNVSLLQCLLAFNGENAVNIYQGAQSVQLYNNTFVGHVHYLWIDGSNAPERPITDVKVLNCIGTGATGRAIVTVAPLGDVTFDYNCWTGEKKGYGEFCLWEMGAGEKAFGFDDLGEAGRWYKLLGQGRHSFSADPVFMDPAGWNFQLSRQSPCVDAGTPIGLPYSGSAPDIGAFELN